MMAASVVLEEQRLARAAAGGRARRIRGCVFFGGWPPWVRVGAYAHLVLRDMLAGVVVDVPTFHVVGSHDPYLQGGLALYNVCHEDRATLFEHGQAHNIPRDAQTVAPLLGDVPVVAGVHPSPLSASRGFFGSRPFSRVDELLVAAGGEPVDWRL